MLQFLQNVAKFQKIQLDNLVDLENAAKRIFTCKDRRRYSRKRAKVCRDFAKRHLKLNFFFKARYLAIFLILQSWYLAILNQSRKGSSSAVWTPYFASKYALESSRRDLQDLHAFAPLGPQYFRNLSSNFFAFFRFGGGQNLNFCKNSSFFKGFLRRCWWNFVRISPMFRKMLKLNEINYSIFWIF